MANESIDYSSLPPKERARIIAVSKLTKHFKGLEDAGVLDVETTRRFLGAVKVLDSLIQGTFIPKP